MVLSLQVEKPFYVWETSTNHLITHMVYRLVKDTSHINNELRLLQEVSHMCSKVSNDVSLH